MFKLLSKTIGIFLLFILLSLLNFAGAVECDFEGNNIEDIIQQLDEGEKQTQIEAINQIKENGIRSTLNNLEDIEATEKTISILLPLLEDEQIDNDLKEVIIELIGESGIENKEIQRAFARLTISGKSDLANQVRGYLLRMGAFNLDIELAPSIKTKIEDNLLDFKIDPVLVEKESLNLLGGKVNFIQYLQEMREPQNSWVYVPIKELIKSFRGEIIESDKNTVKFTLNDMQVELNVDDTGIIFNDSVINLFQPPLLLDSVIMVSEEFLSRVLRLRTEMKLGKLRIKKIDEIPYNIPEKIYTVSADDDIIKVNGDLSNFNIEDIELKLYELPLYAELEDYQNREAIAKKEISNDTKFEFEISRYQENRDLYFSKFLVVAELNDVNKKDIKEPLFVIESDLIFAYPQYVTEKLFSPKNDWNILEPDTKKGILGSPFLISDQEELRLGHSKVSINISQIIYTEKPAGSVNTIEFQVDGQTYYINEDRIKSLDVRIKKYTEYNTRVLLDTLIMPQGPGAKYLVHPDADTEAGRVSGHNTRNEEGISYLRAAYEFLIDRYSREDKKYGRVADFKIGNEVDAQWQWHNTGEATIEETIKYYERSVRLAYLIARKYQKDPRVYISLTKHWTEAAGDGNPLRWYPGRDVLLQMNKVSKKYGDFPWHIDQHSYPQNLRGEPTFWLDEAAQHSINSPIVHFKNLEVLTDFLKREKLLYNGNPRRVILSEQGFQVLEDNLENQKLQAAAYAYAFYRTHFLDGIDAMHYHRIADHSISGILNFGLWSACEERGDRFPGKRRYLWDVFRKIDSNKSLEVTEFAKEIIGIDDWSEVIPGFDPEQLPNRSLADEYEIKSITEVINGKDITFFEENTEGWQPAEYARSVRRTINSFQGTSALLVNLETNGKSWKGTQLSFKEPLNFLNKPYLSLAINLIDVNKVDEDYQVKVKVYSENDWVEGIFSIKPVSSPVTADDWYYIAMDLSGWEGLEQIDRIKVWVRCKNEEIWWDGSLLLDEVKFSKKVK